MLCWQRARRMSLGMLKSAKKVKFGGFLISEGKTGRQQAHPELPGGDSAVGLFLALHAMGLFLRRVCKWRSGLS